MKKMTFGSKMFAGLAGIAVFLVGQSLFSWYSVARLDASLKDAIEVQAKKVELIGNLQSNSANLLAAQRGILLRSMLKDPELVEQYRARHSHFEGEFRKDLSAIRGLLQTDASRRSHESIQQGVEEWVRLTPEFLKLLNEGKFEQAARMQAETFRPAYLKMDQEAASMFQTQREVMEQIGGDARERANSTRVAVMAVFAATLAVLVLIVFVIRKANAGLRMLAGEIADGGQQVAAAARQVSSASQGLAQGSSEQAASLEETSASSEEINSMAHKNSENTRRAADLMTRSQQSFVETNRLLDGSVSAMEEISKQSDKISKIIKTIDEVAFQTNILALNAAVEAARAGEAGMGFAVVAEEVRNLAQRCAQAAKETAALIEETIAKSTDGKVKVSEVTAAIRAIMEEATQVKSLVDEVSVGSEEQARGIDQIGKAIAEIEQVTQRTAANAEESASAAEQLNAQSETLKNIVERLTSMVGGDQSYHRARAR